MRRSVILAPVLIGAAILATSCSSDSKPASQAQEGDRRQSSYDQLVAAQPAHTMDYSPTRDTINFWIDTWKKPNKLSYAYLQNAAGDITGYYVLKGLPVSYCAALTPTYQFVDSGGHNGAGYANTQVPAPSVDGAYYSGGQCNAYYGKDASTGAYIEFTVGQGMNVLLYDQPLPPQKTVGAKPLGPTTTDH